MKEGEKRNRKEQGGGNFTAEREARDKTEGERKKKENFARKGEKKGDGSPKRVKETR